MGTIMLEVLIKFCHEFPFNLNQGDYFKGYSVEEKIYLSSILDGIKKRNLNLEDLKKRFGSGDYVIKILPSIRFLYKYLHDMKILRYKTLKPKRYKPVKSIDNYDYCSKSFLYILQTYDIKNFSIIDIITKNFKPCSSASELKLILALVKSFSNVKLNQTLVLAPKEEKKVEENVEYQEKDWWRERGMPLIKLPFWARRISIEKPKTKLDPNLTKISSYFLD